jgi:hypothetical protein
MNEINWKLDLQVKEGPKFSLNDVIKVEAYDKVDVVVPARGELVVNVQSGEQEAVELILIHRTTAPEAEEGSNTLWYRVGNSTEKVYLKSVHVLLGPGSVKLLSMAPNCLNFKNTHSNDISVTILVARRNSPCTQTSAGNQTTQTSGGDPQTGAGNQTTQTSGEGT